MPRDADSFLDGMITAAIQGGPLVLEGWECEKCGVECFQIHKWVEVLSCSHCGHRVASKAELYRFAMNKAAEDK